MKALVLTDYRKLEILEVPAPEPQAGAVVLRVHSCGICGSDVHGYDGSSGRRHPPLIMGHEASGTIVGLGKGVTGWREGEELTFDSTLYCRECEYCRGGRVNLCENRKVFGVSPGNYKLDGAFAEFLAVPEYVLYRLPEGMNLAHAAFVEPVSVAIHAASRLDRHDGPRKTALVVGAGTIGLLTLQALREWGCEEVYCADLMNSRLRLAKDIGAAGVVNPKEENALEKIREWTGGKGVDVAAEAVGAAPTTELIIQSLRDGGGAVLIGNVVPKVEVSLQRLVTRELSFYGSCGINMEYPRALELIHSGRIQVEPLLSSVAPLEEGAEWFHRLYDADPELVKVMLQP